MSTPFNTPDGVVMFTNIDVIKRLLEYDATGRGGQFNQITATRKCKLVVPSEPDVSVSGGKRHVQPTNTTVDAISFAGEWSERETHVRGSVEARDLARLWQQGWPKPVVLCRPMRLVESIEGDRVYIHFVEAGDVQMCELFKVAEEIKLRASNVVDLNSGAAA